MQRRIVGLGVCLSVSLWMLGCPPPPVTPSKAPTVTSFAIDSGAATTVANEATLTNACTGSPTQYMASEASSFADASWRTYSTGPSFSLSPGTGTKTVFFKVKNAAGTPSAVASDTITLVAPPLVTSFAINNGSASTSNRQVTLNNTCAGSPTQYLASESPTFAGSEWQPYGLAPSFILSPGGEAKTVYFKVTNGSADSTVSTDTITLIAPPLVTSFIINGGEDHVTSRTVTLNNTSTAGSTQYMASESVTFGGASWQPYSSSPSFVLSPSDGPKYVYFKVRTADGTQSAAVSAKTILSEVTTERWSRAYGNPSDINSHAYAVEQTSDGGYVFAGTGDSQQNMKLFKTDAYGNTLWDTSFAVQPYGIGSPFQQTTDGGYILVGTTGVLGPGNTEMYMVKVDAAGNFQWNNHVGGPGNDQACAVQETSDGGYILAGVTTSFHLTGEDMYLAKTDVHGNRQWDKAFQGPLEKSIAYSVRQTADGGYVLAGVSVLQNTSEIVSYAYLVKTDAQGNLQWDKVIPNPPSHVGNNLPGNTHAYTVQQTTDGGYVVAGYAPDPWSGYVVAYLVKTNAQGVTQWDQTLGTPSRSTCAFDVHQTTDGGYILAGTEDSRSNSAVRDMYLVKTDAQGNQQWSSRYWGSIAYAVQETSDGGYVVAGGQLVKTDPQGNAPALAYPRFKK